MPSQPALDEGRLGTSLGALGHADLYQLSDDIHNHIYFWIGVPTAHSLGDLEKSIPFLSQVVDFSVIRNRLGSVGSLSAGRLGIRILDFMPELGTILEATEAAIRALPPGKDKAECFLVPMARAAHADSDVEAAVY